MSRDREICACIKHPSIHSFIRRTYVDSRARAARHSPPPATRRGLQAAEARPVTGGGCGGDGGDPAKKTWGDFSPAAAALAGVSPRILSAAL